MKSQRSIGVVWCAALALVALVAMGCAGNETGENLGGISFTVTGLDALSETLATTDLSLSVELTGPVNKEQTVPLNEEDSLTVTFPDLPEGKYCVSIWLVDDEGVVYNEVADPTCNITVKKGTTTPVETKVTVVCNDCAPTPTETGKIKITVSVVEEKDGVEDGVRIKVFSAHVASGTTINLPVYLYPASDAHPVSMQMDVYLSAKLQLLDVLPGESAVDAGKTADDTARDGFTRVLLWSSTNETEIEMGEILILKIKVNGEGTVTLKNTLVSARGGTPITPVELLAGNVTIK